MKRAHAALLAVAVAAAALYLAIQGARGARPPAPATAVRPGYDAIYNYTITVYSGGVPLGSSVNEFEVRVTSVEGDVVRFYYRQLVSDNATLAYSPETLNYTYALIPSNLTTYYAGFGMPLFVSSSASPGSGSGQELVEGYNITYKYVVTKSDGYVLVSLSASTYSGGNLVSAQYWDYVYNGSTDALMSASGVLLAPPFSYRFEYELVEVKGAGRRGAAR